MPATENAAHEHVYLVADDPDMFEDVEPTSIDAELTQSGGGRRQNTAIFNGTYLEVRTRPKRGDEQWYWLNLAFVDPQPVRRPERLRLSASAACALPTAAVVLLLLLADLPTATVWTRVLPLALLALLAGLGLALFAYFDERVYCTRHGRARVLRLVGRGSDRRRLRAFVQRLESATGQGRGRYTDATPGLYLRDEMREHRRLLEHGVLTPEQFERARAEILRAHG